MFTRTATVPGQRGISPRARSSSAAFFFLLLLRLPLSSTFSGDDVVSRYLYVSPTLSLTPGVCACVPPTLRFLSVSLAASLPLSNCVYSSAREHTVPAGVRAVAGAEGKRESRRAASKQVAKDVGIMMMIRACVCVLRYGMLKYAVCVVCARGFRTSHTVASRLPLLTRDDDKSAPSLRGSASLAT